MADYRAYTVGLDGRFIGFEPLVCANDAEAIERAKLFVGDRSIDFSGTGHASLFVSSPNKTPIANGTEQFRRAIVL